MKFTVHLSFSSYFFIKITDDSDAFIMDIFTEQGIVNYINNIVPFTMEQYIDIITIYNAEIVDNSYYFNYKQDAISAAEFLNDKYMTLINLSGV